MTSRQIVLCHPVRTAIGAYGGSLKDVAATELGAVAVRETLRRDGLRRGLVTLCIGGGQGIALAIEAA